MKITLPTSWGGVTLREYQSYIELIEESKKKLEISTNPKVTEFEVECAIISLFSGHDMDDLLLLNQSSHNNLWNKLGFLSDPIEGKINTRTKLNGRKYYFEKNANKINGGQWITLQHFLTDQDKIDSNLHNLLACFAYRVDWFKKTYNAKEHNQVAEDMRGLPMTFVKPLTDFFLKDWEQSVKSSLRYLEMTAKHLQRKAKKLQRSYQSTDGSTPLTTSQTDVPNFGTFTTT
jgi:hypothetical protein